MVVIQSLKSDRPESESSGSFVTRYGLDRQDGQSIPEFVHGIQTIDTSANRMVIVRRTNAQSLDDDSEAAMVMAVSPRHRVFRNLKIVDGSELHNQDFELATSKCLISADAAKRWFGTTEAIGQYIRLQGVAVLLVSGVFEFSDRPNTLLTSPEIVIPLATYDQRFATLDVTRRSGSFSASQVQYSEFQINTVDGSDVNDITDGIRQYLLRRYPDRDFRIKTLRLKTP